MTDITEQLEKLASLRDRGVLTQEEFDAQKAMLLRGPATPPVEPAPIPATPAFTPTAATTTVERGGLPVWAFVAGGVALLLAIGAALWATGSLERFGIGGSSSDNSSVAFTPFPTATTSSTMPSAAPTLAAPIAPTLPTTTTASADNPLYGDWINDGGDSASCPSRVSFSPTMLTMTRVQDGIPSVKEAAMTYEVQAGGAVKLTAADNPANTTMTYVEGTHMRIVDGDCSYRRP